MPNTIQLHLLDNKQIKAEMQGIPLANENSYKIIAGEENATIFQIASKPTQYLSARYTVEMVNSQGKGIVETTITNNQFTLPYGMAVAGYGKILIRARQGNEVVPFIPLPIKIWNTLPDWIEHISNDKDASESWVKENFASDILVSLDNTNYVLSFQLKNKNNETLGTEKQIDLPLESTVVDGSYNNNTKSLILTLKNNNTITIPIGDLVEGLQSTLTAGAGISIDNNVIAVTNKGGTFTVLSTDWNNDSVTINFSGLGANDKIDVGALTYSDQVKINEAQLFVTASTGSITITAQTTPSTDIAFQYFITKGVA